MNNWYEELREMNRKIAENWAEIAKASPFGTNYLMTNSWAPFLDNVRSGMSISLKAWNTVIEHQLQTMTDSLENSKQYRELVQKQLRETTEFINAVQNVNEQRNTKLMDDLLSASPSEIDEVDPNLTK